MTNYLLKDRQWKNLTPEQAGWEYVSFDTVELDAGATLDFAADSFERAIIPLSGSVRVSSGDEIWELGGRKDVFDSLGDALYLPFQRGFTIQATTGSAQVAVAGAKATEQYEPKLVLGREQSIEVRGAGNATRQINTLIPPDFPAHKIIVVEVWTPGGNWSSYPPHKHDVEGENEAILEETYFYKTRTPQGFALQRLYSPERKLELTETVRDGDLLVIPHGYHTTAAAHGHDLYYLNVLAGPGQKRTLSAFEDPDHAEIRKEWEHLETDSRVPFVPLTPGEGK